MPSLKIKTIMDNLEEMIDFVLAGLEKRDFAGKENFKAKLRLVCEEAMVNIIKYAYPEDEEGYIEIVYKFLDDNTLVLKLIDQGIAFNPLSQKEPDTELAINERPIGSLGIYMIKNIMDDLDYEREDGSNIFTLTKDLNNLS